MSLMNRAGSDDFFGNAFQSPFSNAAEDLLRYYFMNYWNTTGKFPPFDDLHQRVHETEWFKRVEDCPGTMHMKRTYEKLREEIA